MKRCCEIREVLVKISFIGATQLFATIGMRLPDEHLSFQVGLQDWFDDGPEVAAENTLLALNTDERVVLFEATLSLATRSLE